MGIYSSKCVEELNNTINFWNKNEPQFGAALDLKPHVWDTLRSGRLLTPVFENCTFILNRISECNNCTDSPMGARGSFLAIGFTIQFRENLLFIDNSGSAMHITSCILKFHSGMNATFINNTGFVGGAIALIGLSSLNVLDNSVFTFIDNTAYGNGGAIYFHSIDKHDLVASHSCFIQYTGCEQMEERNLTFNFSGNKAGRSSTNRGKNSIHATSLQPCRYACKQSTKDKDQPLFNCIGNFTFNGSRQSQYDISTSAFMINASLHGDHMSSNKLQVIPGKEIEIPIHAWDDLEQEVDTQYYVSIEGSSTIKIDHAYSIIRNKTRLFGKPNAEGILKLWQMGFRRATITFTVKMRECPSEYCQSIAAVHMC